MMIERLVRSPVERRGSDVAGGCSIRYVVQRG